MLCRKIGKEISDKFKMYVNETNGMIDDAIQLVPNIDDIQTLREHSQPFIVLIMAARIIKSLAQGYVSPVNLLMARFIQMYHRPSLSDDE